MKAEVSEYTKKLEALEQHIISYVAEFGNTKTAARKITKMIITELDLDKCNAPIWPTFKTKKDKARVQEIFKVWEPKIIRFARRQAYYTIQGFKRKVPADYNEIYQECVIAFINMLNTYDAEHDYLPFETRLFSKMKWAMCKYFSKNAKTSSNTESYDTGIAAGKESEYLDVPFDNNYYRHDEHFS